MPTCTPTRATPSRHAGTAIAYGRSTAWGRRDPAFRGLVGVRVGRSGGNDHATATTDCSHVVLRTHHVGHGRGIGTLIPEAARRPRPRTGHPPPVRGHLGGERTDPGAVLSRVRQPFASIAVCSLKQPTTDLPISAGQDCVPIITSYLRQRGQSSSSTLTSKPLGKSPSAPHRCGWTFLLSVELP